MIRTEKIGQKKSDRKNRRTEKESEMSCVWILFLFISLTPFILTHASDEENEIWLANNAQKEGVIQLPSGLQYKFLRKGTGDSHPTIDSQCDCRMKHWEVM